MGSEESELRLAQRFLEQAVAADSGLAEALLRLGRVTGLLGDHDRAVTALSKAAAAMTDLQLLYYAAMFLGREQEARGRRDAAREEFERAAGLYPAAQSPLLALSHLASREGDPPRALVAMERALTLPIKELECFDPWWTYDVAHVRNAEALMIEMRKAFGGLPR
ncbi:MAG: hypothetical protein LAP85_11310 [Acidobacteriia bacterium]|nr:hypothetical protein [Terriglobia bacterium]